ncbi:hypothetical protein D3C81_1949070 [compost metagenome]
MASSVIRIFQCCRKPLDRDTDDLESQCRIPCEAAHHAHPFAGIHALFEKYLLESHFHFMCDVHDPAAAGYFGLW